MSDPSTIPPSTGAQALLERAILEMCTRFFPAQQGIRPVGYREVTEVRANRERVQHTKFLFDDNANLQDGYITLYVKGVYGENGTLLTEKKGQVDVPRIEHFAYLSEAWEGASRLHQSYAARLMREFRGLDYANQFAVRRLSTSQHTFFGCVFTGEGHPEVLRSISGLVVRPSVTTD